MLIALVATAIQLYSGAWAAILVGVAIGAAIGIYSARAVKMTAMPQMVALFNGAGGGAAALVATAEFLKLVDESAGAALPFDQTITIVLSTVIGAISFSGSIIAFLKLQELMTGRPITYPGQQFVNGAIALGIVVAAGLVIANVSSVPAFFALFALASRAGRSCSCCRSAARTCRSSSRCSTRSPASPPRRPASCSATTC